jgi:integron integrase
MPDGKPKLLEQVANCMRLQRMSPKTISVYLDWIRRFIRFNRQPDGKYRHPSEMGVVEIGKFLTHLIGGRNGVSASTQKQALCALVYLYGRVLKIELGDISFLRSRRSPRLPEVLSRDEVWRVLDSLQGDFWLMSALLYGCGLRLMECCQLRVGDVDFERKTVTVRAGKGDKDRMVPLPGLVLEPLERHLIRVRRIHEQDLAAGWGEVDLPGALARKFPQAPWEWRWQWVFPATTRYVEKKTGVQRRWHMHETAVQKRLKGAARRTGITKRVHPHVLRHSFATHWLEDATGAQDIVLPRLQRLMGHQRIETTMIYVHMITPTQIASPLDHRPAARMAG